MKAFLKNIFTVKKALWTVLLALLALATGCISENNSGPGVDPPPPPSVDLGDFDKLRIDDRVEVWFSGSPAPPPNHEERVKSDGTLTLPHIGSVQASGKTTKELEVAIKQLYVPRFYKRLNITVKREERFFWVSGEVEIPGRINYLGELTVLKAITAAGDFTDFAKRKRIELTRQNGKKFIIDAEEAQKNPALDLPVYPGDRIKVPIRRW